MTDAQFALTFDPDTWVPQLLETLKVNSYPDARIVMRDLYLNHAGIFPSLDRSITKDRPMFSVALHESENVNSVSRLNSAIEMFILKDINKYTGLTIMEYLGLPHDYILMINNAVQLKRKHMESASSSLANELENMGG